MEPAEKSWPVLSNVEHLYVLVESFSSGTCFRAYKRSALADTSAAMRRVREQLKVCLCCRSLGTFEAVMAHLEHTLLM